MTTHKPRMTTNPHTQLDRTWPSSARVSEMSPGIVTGRLGRLSLRLLE